MKNLLKKKRLITLYSCGLILLLVIFWQGYLAWQAYNSVKEVKSQFTTLSQQVKDQDYVTAEKTLNQTGQNLTRLHNQVAWLILLNKLPPISKYKKDIDTTKIFFDQRSNNIKVILDILSQGKSFNNLKPRDRQMVINNLSLVANSAQPLLEIASDFGTNYKDLSSYQQALAQSSILLGSNHPANYVVIFQNNTELRPTGGFWGAYSQLSVNAGVVSDIKSYPLSNLNLTPSQTEAPADITNIITSITKQPPSGYFINGVSEFALPASSVAQAAVQKTGQPITGVVAIDIPAIKSLLKITGPIQVKDFGEINSNNVEQSLVYELNIQNPDPTLYDEHKSILGDIGDELINKLYQKDPVLLGSWLASQIKNRDILLYSSNPRIQTIATNLGIDGSFNKKGNFIHLEETNFGGKQSDFLKRSVKVEKVGQDTFKATIHYDYPNNTAAQKLKYPTAKMLVRLRVPANSKLINSVGGVQDNGNRLNILDTTGLSNVIFLSPGESKSLSFEYSVSSDISGSNSLPTWSFQPAIN